MHAHRTPPAPPPAPRPPGDWNVAELKPAVSLGKLLGLLALLILAAAIVVALPLLSPSVARSLLGAEPKAYWFVSRASAFVSFELLTLSMVFGLLITSKAAPAPYGKAGMFELHQHTSLLGLGFALLHTLVLLGDRYIGFTLFELLVPFASANYRPEWVGVGQLALYVTALVAFSFYFRKAISQRGWRILHFASFATYLMIVLHAVFSGTDTSEWWAVVIYIGSACVVAALTLWRILKPTLPEVTTTRSKRT